MNLLNWAIWAYDEFADFDFPDEHDDGFTFTVFNEIEVLLVVVIILLIIACYYLSGIKKILLNPIAARKREEERLNAKAAYLQQKQQQMEANAVEQEIRQARYEEQQEVARREEESKRAQNELVKAEKKERKAFIDSLYAAGFNLDTFSQAAQAAQTYLGVDASAVLNANDEAALIFAWSAFWPQVVKAAKANPQAAQAIAEVSRQATALYAQMPKNPKYNP